MAAPTKTSHPGRTVVAFLIAILAVAGVAFLADDTPRPKLGLDLEGGTSITLTAKTTDGSDVTPEALDTAVEIIRSRVDSQGVSESTVTTQGSNTIVVAVPGIGQDELVQLVGTTAQLRFRQVCFQGAGTNPPPVTQTPTPTDSSTVPPTGSPTPTAPTTGAPSPSASAVPGTETPTALGSADSAAPSSLGRFGASAGSLRGFAQTLAGSATPTVEPVDTAAPSPSASPSDTSAATATPTPSPTDTDAPPAATDCEAAATDTTVQQAYVDLDCSDPASLEGGVDTPDEPIAACSEDGAYKFLLARATVLGTDVSDAQAGIPQGGLSWQVNLTFNGDGSKKFTAMSRALFGLPDASTITSPQATSQFGIVLDNVVVSYPVMQGVITGNTAEITGTFTQVEAQQLANVLKYGALPLAFDTSDVSEVTPTLGSASLRAGLIAGAIGLGLVLVYALLYYRALGFVVVASLIVAAAVTYLAVVLLSDWISFTLTLSGIAGLIVAIGITADSFIIYFERIRDEVREGRTLRAAVEHGWLRARRTIISADFVSLLSSVVLYIVSIGNVRGFAFALGLSTVIDLAVVFLFTKPLMSWLASRGQFGVGGRLAGIGRDHLATPTRRRGAKTSGATAVEEI